MISTLRIVLATPPTTGKTRAAKPTHRIRHLRYRLPDQDHPRAAAFSPPASQVIYDGYHILNESSSCCVSSASRVRGFDAPDPKPPSTAVL